MKTSALALLMLFGCASPKLTQIERRLAFADEGFEGYKDCSASSQEEYDQCHQSQKRSPYYLLHEGENHKAALLIHGLSDGPFMHKDIAWALYEKGYNVLVPLMPGHGAENEQGIGQPQALHAVRWQDWTEHLTQNVLPLVQSIGSEHIIIGGLSNGGHLSIRTITKLPAEIKAKVKGLMLFSPTIALPRVMIALNGLAIRSFTCSKNGFMSDTPYTGGGESFRYMLMSANGVCQAQRMIEDTKVSDNYHHFTNIPVFGVLTEDDTAIDQDAFNSFMSSTGKQKNTFIVFKKGSLQEYHESLQDQANRASGRGRQVRLSYASEVPPSTDCVLADASDCAKAHVEGWQTFVMKKGNYIDHAGVTLSHRPENLQHIDESAPERTLNPYYQYTLQKLGEFVDRLND